MGLIVTGTDTATDVLEDAWRDHVFCDGPAPDMLMSTGRRRTGEGRGTVGDNLLSAGSIVAVGEGQCAIVACGSDIVEFCAEAGEYLFDPDVEPTARVGRLGADMRGGLARIGHQRGSAGDATDEPRISFVNTQTIPSNRFETHSNVPYHQIDPDTGAETDVPVRLSGEYSYRIVNPLTFYGNVAGDTCRNVTRASLETQLTRELLAVLHLGLEGLSERGIRCDDLSSHKPQVTETMRSLLRGPWGSYYGIELTELTITSMGAAEGEEHREKGEGRGTGCVSPEPVPAPPRSWACPSCGMANEGRFCTECGRPRPKRWRCPVCGTSSTGNFCPECGGRRP